MLYFAYGSNMNWEQMKVRCPSARFVGVALLRDHRIAFTRRSVTRGCGVVDVVADVGRRLWGVVYEITDLDVGMLDTSEGYRPGRETNAQYKSLIVAGATRWHLPEGYIQELERIEVAG